MGKIINGKIIAGAIKRQLKEEVSQLDNKPTLAVILVGDDVASQVYVRNKKRACEEVGIISKEFIMPANCGQYNLLTAIRGLNNCPDIHGILVQLPLPSGYDYNEKEIIEAIDPRKDVDGFTKNSLFVPCTPAGVLCLLDDIPDYDLAGKTALVIGRSDIVGKPVAKLLLDRNCTVMQANRRTTKDILCRMFSFADIVVSAAGRRDIISEDDAEQYFKDNRHDFYGDFLNKRDRIIIDVGINRDENSKLCGDFSEEFKKKYSNFYTPVPGGVGPMTIAMLLKNTILAAKLLTW